MNGIYLLTQTLGSPGATKTLVTGAYNNRGLDITDLDEFFVHRSTEDWSWDSHEFVQDDDAYCVMAAEHIVYYQMPLYDDWSPVGYYCTHWATISLPQDHLCTSCVHWWEYFAPPPTGEIKETNWCDYYNDHPTKWMPYRPPYYVDAYQKSISDMEDLYTFQTTTHPGTVAKVTVWAEVRGEAELSIQLGAGTRYYSGPTFINHRYGWEAFEHTTKPGGGSWAWSDLTSGNLKAGIYLYYDASGMAACRRLKVVVTTSTGAEVTVWPNATSENECMVAAGNYLEDFDLCTALEDSGDRTLPILQAVRTSSSEANKYITSDLSELAPNFSVIGSIAVDYAYRASTPDADSYVRPYLVIAGTKYYGTSHTLGNTYALQEFSYTWSTNPATSAAWDYDDYKGAQFGLHVYADADSTYLYLYGLKATTSYQERRLEPVYSLLPARFISRKECSQNPLTADELIFASDAPIAERMRIAYFRDNTLKFLGFVWSCAGSGHNWMVTAKGYQAALPYRYLPSIEYNPAVDKLDGPISMSDILSADAPTHPLHSHGGKMAVCFNGANDWVDTPVSDFIMGHESDIGIMCMINSVIPVSQGDSAGRIPGLGGLTVGRQVFGMDRIITQLSSPMRTYNYSSVNGYDGWVDDIYAEAAEHHSKWGSETYVSGYSPAGLRRLKKHTSSTCTDEQYYAASNGDLYLEAWPDNQVLLIHNALDSFIDVSENDLDEWCINEAVAIDGKANTVLDNIFALAGQEVVATPALDGRIHLSAKISNCRGSESDPIMVFRNGKNCKIKTQIPAEPAPDVVVGYDISEKCSSAWAPKHSCLLKALQTSKTGDNLQGYLDALLDDDQTTYEITAGIEAIILRPYDYISVDGIAARVREIHEYPEKVIVYAGKKPFRLVDRWGEWRGDLIYQDRDLSTAAKEFSGSSFPLSDTFTVWAREISRGDWSARLNLGWEIVTDGAEIEATTSPKATVTLNSRKIATLLLPGKSGNVNLDITDRCSTSASSDTSNTISISLVGHLTGAHVYHEITAKVEQLRTEAVLEND